MAFNDGMNISGWNTFYIKVVLWTLLLIQQWKEPQQKPYPLPTRKKNSLRILVKPIRQLLFLYNSTYLSLYAKLNETHCNLPVTISEELKKAVLIAQTLKTLHCKRTSKKDSGWFILFLQISPKGWTDLALNSEARIIC